MIILAVDNTAAWTAARRDAATRLLPQPEIARAARYRRWQDAQATLLGRLLLRQALRRRGKDSALIAAITIDAADRPSLPDGPDFSISHAEGLVVLAVSDDGRVGIDVEHRRPIAPDDLGPALTAADRRRIAAAADPVVALLQCWTAKEAVVKAAGLGITVADLPAWPDNGPVICDGQPWWIAAWALPGHVLTLAYGRPFVPPVIETVGLDALLGQI